MIKGKRENRVVKKNFWHAYGWRFISLIKSKFHSCSRLIVFLFNFFKSNTHSSNLLNCTNIISFKCHLNNFSFILSKMLKGEYTHFLVKEVVWCDIQTNKDTLTEIVLFLSSIFIFFSFSFLLLLLERKWRGYSFYSIERISPP